MYDFSFSIIDSFTGLKIINVLLAVCVPPRLLIDGSCCIRWLVDNGLLPFEHCVLLFLAEFPSPNGVSLTESRESVTDLFKEPVFQFLGMQCSKLTNGQRIMSAIPFLRLKFVKLDRSKVTKLSSHCTALWKCSSAKRL